MLRRPLPTSASRCLRQDAGREAEADPVFGLAVPTTVPDVPTRLLQPREAWADKEAYDATAAKLASMFHANMEKYASELSAEILGAGPLSGRP